MTTEQIIETLREYNAWRRGGEGEMLDPKLIGKAIDAACDAMEAMQRERDEAREQRDNAVDDYETASLLASRMQEQRDRLAETLKDNNAKLRREIDELNKQLIEASKMGVDLLIERDEARKSLARMHEIIRSEWPKDQAEELIKGYE